MRETRQSGSEGGARSYPLSLPLSLRLFGEVPVKIGRLTRMKDKDPAPRDKCR